MRRNRVIALLGGALLVATTTGLAGASESERKCEAGKYKCMAGIGSGLMGCYSKNAGKPEGSQATDPAPLLDACVAKVTTKFNGGAFPVKGCFEKLELKAEKVGSTTPCVTSNDTPDLESLAESFALGAAGDADGEPAPATLPISKCNAAKDKCVASKVKGLVGCYSKRAGKADPGDVLFNACTAKVIGKFGPCIGKAELGIDCASTGQSGTLETDVDNFVSNVVGALSCGNGRPDPGEGCDDDNFTSGDGCDDHCRPEVCGDGIISTLESCDDGNTNNNDACPSDCKIDACTPNSGTHQQATVSFAGVSIAGISVLVDYPEGTVAIPGSGPAASSRISGLPSGTSGVTNDLDHALREVVQDNTPFATFAPGQLFKIDFETCSGAPALTTADFAGKCTVISASNAAGSDVTGSVTCSVTVP